MGHADGEDQERHQDRHRVDAQAQQRQQAEQPDHRQQRHHQRHHGQLERARIAPQQRRGDQEGHHEEAHHRAETLDHVADQLGEADHVDLDLIAIVVRADFLEALGYLDVGNLLAGLRVDVLQVGTHHRGLQVVGHQTADLSGARSVVAHLLEIFEGAGEARRHHHVAEEAVLGHLDVLHVGGEQRGHAGAADPGGKEYVVGDLAQGFEEHRVVDVTLALPAHTDQEAVGTGEDLAVFEEVHHVFVAQRNQLVEARVQPGLQGTGAEADGDRDEQRHQCAAAGHQQVGAGRDPAIHPGVLLFHLVTLSSARRLHRRGNS
ncbi:hypothetical protein D3C85_906420 [compost metagenome]